MFTALSSFIPNILILGDKDKQEQPVDSAGDRADENERHPDIAIDNAPATMPTVDTSAMVLARNALAGQATPRPRRAKQEKPLCETYIIVRPPPAKNNHPLNLQIQLVPPRHLSARSANRHSGDFSGSESTPVDSAVSPANDDSTLQRTASNYSDRSIGFYASSSSVGSVGSLASTNTAGPARRIVPLYNLSAHNVMTNTVTDAGTDAKVAKFQKRCLEIIRVGAWEPVEIWSRQLGSRIGSSSFPEEYGRLNRPGTVTSGGHELKTDLFVRDAPEAAENNRRIGFLETISPSPPPADTPKADPGTPQHSSSNTKKFFGKVFKGKRDSTSLLSPSSLQVPTQNSPTQTLSLSRSFKRQSYQPPNSPISLSPSISNQSSLVSQASAGPAAPVVQPVPGDPVLQPPILGLQAAIHASVHGTPTGRPTTHLWILRKWAKEKQLNPEGILRGFAAGLAARSGNGGSNGGSNSQVGSTAGMEIRFEWTRGTSKSKTMRQGATRARIPSTREDVYRRALVEEDRDDVTVSSGHSKTSLPRSPDPSAHLPLPNHGSAQKRDSVGLTSERSVSSQPDSHEDAEEDSDIEDSETPWTCTMHIYPSNLSPLSDRDAKERAAAPGSSHDGRLRLRLASLVPTPHHPKILVQFRMPFPLPDVAITPDVVVSGWAQSRYDYGIGARFLPRTLSPDGTIQHSKQGPILGTEIMFTAEDIKDVVSSTALWLVVREGFGGLGRTKRKGDGWHIRA